LQNQGFSSHFRIIRKDEKKNSLVEEFADVIIKKNDKIAYIKGIMFDITQRKERQIGLLKDVIIASITSLSFSKYESRRD
jgi:preprotein translocase subunit YajC